MMDYQGLGVSTSAIQYQCGYKYQLYADHMIRLPDSFAGYSFAQRFYALQGQVLTIRAGYSWNGASGPTWDDKSNMRGSLVHDALYQAMVEGHLPRTLRPLADEILRQLCIEDGMNRIRAWFWHRSVARFGLRPSIRNKDIMVAP